MHGGQHRNLPLIKAKRINVIGVFNCKCDRYFTTTPKAQWPLWKTERKDCNSQRSARTRAKVSSGRDGVTALWTHCRGVTCIDLYIIKVVNIPEWKRDGGYKLPPLTKEELMIDDLWERESLRVWLLVGWPWSSDGPTHKVRKEFLKRTQIAQEIASETNEWECMELKSFGTEFLKRP